MDIIKLLKQDENLSDLLCYICDVEILSEFKSPQDEFGHLAYSITGKTFAKEGTGSEYILLEDGSVGFWGSEGESGRIADSLYDFFVFMVNCPFWRDYVNAASYQNMERLQSFAKELMEEHRQMVEEDMDMDLDETQKELAEGLSISLDSDISNVLMKFYYSATREPRLITTYTENDGSTHSNTGSLFESKGIVRF